MDKELVAMFTSIIERMFPDISGAFTTEIISNLTQLKLDRGAVLVKQGDCSDHMYIVETGSLLQIMNATHISDAQEGTRGDVALPSMVDSADEFVQGMTVNRSALCFDFPASKTVVAASESVVWGLRRLVFKSVQKRAVCAARGRCVEVLKGVEEFCFLPELKMNQFANSFSSATFANGECLSTQDNPTSRMIIIESGFVQVECDGNIISDLGPMENVPNCSFGSDNNTGSAPVISPGAFVPSSGGGSNYNAKYDIVRSLGIPVSTKAKLDDASRIVRQLSKKHSFKGANNESSSAECGSPGSPGTTPDNTLALIYPGCFLGLSVLRARRGGPGAWEYMCYVNSMNQTVYGFKSPFTLRAIGKVCAWVISIQSFEANVMSVSSLSRHTSLSAAKPFLTTGGSSPSGRLSSLSNTRADSLLGNATANGLSGGSKKQFVAFRNENSTMGIIQTSLRSAGLSFLAPGPNFRTLERTQCWKVLGSSSICQAVHCTVQNPHSFFVDSKCKDKDSMFETGSYVMKVYNKAATLAEGRVDVVLREAELLSAVDSLFVSRLVWQFQTANSLCIVVDALEYGDLFQLLHPPSGESLFETGVPGELVQYFCACVLLALRHMHAMGIAYRNLKPENVMLDGRGMAKLVGLDLAKHLPYEDFAESSTVTVPVPAPATAPATTATESSMASSRSSLNVRTFTLCGCPEYIAPEQVMDRGHDISVDMWGLGILAYELYLSHTPFSPEAEVSDVMVQPADRSSGASSVLETPAEPVPVDVPSVLNNIMAVEVSVHVIIRSTLLFAGLCVMLHCLGASVLYSRVDHPLHLSPQGF